MTFTEVMSALKALSNEKVYKDNAKRYPGHDQFGVPSADLRALSKKAKGNPELAEELWKSGNMDAMMLATLLMKPKQISTTDLDRRVGSLNNDRVADWLATSVVKLHPEKESRREQWMNSDHLWTARMGWSLTVERIVKNPEGMNPSALLDRIEAEMGSAPAPKQWMMNYCLAEIGINFPELRARAIAIGEKLGVLKDYPVSKGCTSPYAPIWISAMVARKV